VTCGRGQRQRRRAARAGGRGNAVGLTSIFDRGLFLHREAETETNFLLCVSLLILDRNW